jgi:biopolymer transport protein ExbD
VTGDPESARVRGVALLALRRAEVQRVGPTVRSEINVTPLVDVVLVLLIIFMVVTPLIASGVAVDLPRTHFHARKPDDGKDIVVSVTADHRYYLAARPMLGVEELARQIVAEKRRFPDKGVFVKGDARAPYGEVRELMEALHEAAIDDVVLGTEEAAPAAGPR